MPGDDEQLLPTWREALTLLVAGVVIFLSSCFGGVALANNGFEGVRAIVVVGTIFGGIVLIAGFVLLLIVAFATVFRRLRRTKNKGAQ